MKMNPIRVCLTQWESQFDTQKTHKNKNGSTDYGIFQINSRWWCDDGETESANTCGISCNVLTTDNVQAAIACAKRIPINQWVAWRTRCRGQDLSSYLAGCNLR
ncbi:lysozyme C-like isoform X2 [Kryptolebias marmoratus]|uniref:lysozyme C-like isoform X2 n=1 Tax=Kryptolebias marmoratus TaxID=37003 RepID=UPI0018ACE80D|nr:lysozyme C-like isoform X2 [Kryptolebias marmoratus]